MHGFTERAAVRFFPAFMLIVGLQGAQKIGVITGKVNAGCCVIRSRQQTTDGGSIEAGNYASASEVVQLGPPFPNENPACGSEILSSFLPSSFSCFSLCFLKEMEFLGTIFCLPLSSSLHPALPPVDFVVLI